MRKIAEIRNDLNAKIAEVKGIDRANVEAMEAATRELEALVAELNAANEVEAAEQRAAENKFNQMQKNAGRQFSLLKFIREIAAGNLSGLEAEVAEMGSEEYRRLGLSQSGTVLPNVALRSIAGNNYTTAADGGNLIETMAPRWVDLLKQKLVLNQMGATFLTDLVGTVPVISSAQIAAGWGAEGADASVTKAAFAKATMTPHRNFIQTAVTKDLLRQNSLDVEGYLLDLMVQAHANLIENAAINGTGASGQPTGILNKSGVLSVSTGSTPAAIDWDAVVALETQLNSNNSNKGRVGYLMNPKVWGACKTTAKFSGGDTPIMPEVPGNRLNGYYADFSNYVPSNLTKGPGSSAVTNLSAMIMGNFQDLYIGQWGGLDIVVDPYTLAKSAQIVLTLNAWNDVLVAEPKSFAVCKDIVAA